MTYSAIGALGISPDVELVQWGVQRPWYRGYGPLVPDDPGYYDPRRPYGRRRYRGRWRVVAPYAGLGDGSCGPCTIPAGSQCLPCPDESDVPECAGCVGGRLPEPEQSWVDRSKWAYPTLLTVIGALATGVAMAYAAKRFGVKG